MKTTHAILSILAGVAVLAACGRPSSDNRFTFDGSGDPHLPAGTIVPGKFAGSLEISDWKTQDTNYQALFGGGDVLLMQSLFNASPIAGLGDFPVLVLGNPPPPRNGSFDPAFPCYYDLGPLPELGGSIDSLDVGPTVHPKFQLFGQSLDLNRQPDAPNGPALDVLYYFGAYLGGNTSDNDVTIKWDGGTLAGIGYAHAPLRNRNDVEIRQPPAVTGIMVNGTSLGGTIAAASSYQINWTPWDGTGSIVAPFNVNGMEIVAQIYGPADLSSGTKTEVEDWPWFNRLGQLVCIVDDASGSFTLQQAWLDELLARVMDTTAYARSTEDVNHDGVLQPRTGNGTTGFQGEDANGNGTVDKIYGTVLFVNRRTENQFLACLKGTDENTACSKAGNIFISGNDTSYARMKFATP